jgi:hypothetical protein
MVAGIVQRDHVARFHALLKRHEHPHAGFDGLVYRIGDAIGKQLIERHR